MHGLGISFGYRDGDVLARTTGGMSGSSRRRRVRPRRSRSRLTDDRLDSDAPVARHGRDRDRLPSCWLSGRRTTFKEVATSVGSQQRRLMQPLTGRPAIYARFSSARQDERSIDDQVRRCRAHLNDRSSDVEVFADYAVSGAGLNRPGFEALMTAVDSGLVTAIVTEDISRISRDFADAAHIFRRLQYRACPAHRRCRWYRHEREAREADLHA